MPAGLSPRLLARSAIIYADCKAFGWERTIAEIAQSCGMTTQNVIQTLHAKGWTGRVRQVGHAERHKYDSYTSIIDRELSVMAGLTKWGAE